MTAKPKQELVVVTQCASLPVIVITSHDQLGNTERARALGSVDYLLKPLNESQLLAAIGKALGTLG